MSDEEIDRIAASMYCPIGVPHPSRYTYWCREFARAVLVSTARGCNPEKAGEDAGAMPDASLSPADGNPGVMAWMWQHEETGRTGFVDAWQVGNGWQAANPRLKLVRPLVFAPDAEKQRLVPVEPPAELAPLLTGYTLADKGLSQQDRSAVTALMRMRWEAILAAVEKDALCGNDAEKDAETAPDSVAPKP
jgi:hypothetical protein